MHKNMLSINLWVPKNEADGHPTLYSLERIAAASPHPTHANHCLWLTRHDFLLVFSRDRGSSWNHCRVTSCKKFSRSWFWGWVYLENITATYMAICSVFTMLSISNMQHNALLTHVFDWHHHHHHHVHHCQQLQQLHQYFPLLLSASRLLYKRETLPGQNSPPCAPT